MPEGIAAVLSEAERVCKKQKTCALQTSQGVDQLLQYVKQAQRDLACGTGHSYEDTLSQLHQRLQSTNVLTTATNLTKELHSAVTKLGKAIDKAFIADVCKASRGVDFDRTLLDAIIAQHLYQEGNFAVGDVFVQEAGIMDGDTLKEPFVAMHQVLCQIQQRNLTPAKAWIDSHAEELQRHGVPDSFEFHLHRLQFLHILCNKGQQHALQYARVHFGRFRHSQLSEIQRLMGCICFSSRLEHSPYADLLSQDLWDDFLMEFARQCCNLVGQSCHSPLLVSIAAGAVALPTLLKVASVIHRQVLDIKETSELTVELELGKEFVFHSIFACPVSKEQSSPENPPMLLPCGHVLCKTSILRIAKTVSRAFKCPYCPAEATFAACQQLNFPDME